MPHSSNADANAKLTSREELFAQAIASGTTKAEAHRRAGFSPNAAPGSQTHKVDGNKRLKKPNVAKRVTELQAKHAKKFEITFEGQFRKLEEIRLGAIRKGDYKAAAAAVIAENRMAGLEVQRIEATLRVPSADPGSPDEMTEADWTRLHGGGGSRLIEHDSTAKSAPDPDDASDWRNMPEAKGMYDDPVYTAHVDAATDSIPKPTSGSIVDLNADPE